MYITRMNLNVSRASCFKISAPAVVVLAAAVSTAVANETLPTRPDAIAPDLSWAVLGGATHSVRGTRAYIARTAATAINSLDRLCGAKSEIHNKAFNHISYSSCQVVVTRTINSVFNCIIHSSHQHSAP